MPRLLPQQSQEFGVRPVVTPSGNKDPIKIYKGRRGELVWDEDRKTLVELDGSTKGGRPVKYVQVTTVTSTPYTVKDDDTFIAVNVSGAATINLPAGEAGRYLIIKDISGAASTNNITVKSSAGEQIDGANSYVINTNYGSIEIGWIPS